MGVVLKLDSEWGFGNSKKKVVRFGIVFEGPLYSSDG